MNIYKVWIQINQVDESQNHHRNVGEPYEAGTFTRVLPLQSLRQQDDRRIYAGGCLY